MAHTYPKEEHPMITRYRRKDASHVGPSVYALMRDRSDDVRWCKADTPIHSMSDFERELELAGDCNVFKFLRPKHALLIVHDVTTNEILVIAREFTHNTVTSIYMLNTYGQPHWEAFERLTRYLKNSGWLDANPRLYNHWPLSLLADSMQRDYGKFIDEMDAEDFSVGSYYGGKSTTFMQRLRLKFERARLYTPRKD